MPVNTQLIRNDEPVTIKFGWTFHLYALMLEYFRAKGVNVGSEYEMTFDKDLDFDPAYNDSNGDLEEIVHVKAGDKLRHWR